jgi:hypothetical protein
MKGKQVVTALKVKWKVDQLYNGFGWWRIEMPIADSPWVLILQCLGINCIEWTVDYDPKISDVN